MFLLWGVKPSFMSAISQQWGQGGRVEVDFPFWRGRQALWEKPWLAMARALEADLGSALPGRGLSSWQMSTSGPGWGWECRADRCEKTRQSRPQGNKVAAESMWDLSWTRGGAGQGHLIRAGTLASRESPGKETAQGSSYSPASKRKEIFPEKNFSNGTNRKWHQIG